MGIKFIESKFNQAQCRHLLGQIVTSGASPQAKSEILKEAFAWGSDPTDGKWTFKEEKPNPKAQSYWAGLHARLHNGNQLTRKDRENIRRVLNIPVQTITTGIEHKALLKRFGLLNRKFTGLTHEK